jgi:4-hydroxybenzoate polyprenyltransferase
LPGLLPYLRLLRVGTLFSPGADVVAGICVLALPWSWAAGRAVLASVCLYAAGMVWNDVADRRQDARLRPERPLPRGDVTLRAAVALGAALIVAGLTLSPCRAHHAVIAALVLAYDFALKRAAVVGASTMGVLRALNLAVAWSLAAPLDPAAAPALAVAALCYAVYIVAVTVLGIFEDQPHVRARAVVAVQTAPPLAALVGLAVVQGGVWPVPAAALVPVLWFARRNRQQHAWDQAAIRRSMTLLLLGTMLYTALLCGAAARWLEAAAIAGCVPVARAIARRISLT